MSFKTPQNNPVGSVQVIRQACKILIGIALLIWLTPHYHYVLIITALPLRADIKLWQQQFPEHSLWLLSVIRAQHIPDFWEMWGGWGCWNPSCRNSVGKEEFRVESQQRIAAARTWDWIQAGIQVWMFFLWPHIPHRNFVFHIFNPCLLCLALGWILTQLGMKPPAACGAQAEFFWLFEKSGSLLN